VRIEESSAGRTLSGVPVKHYQRWAQRSDVFERIAPYIRDTVTLTGDGDPDQVIAVRSLGLFPALGVPARLGRTLVSSDDEEGSRNVAVLSDRLWRRRYHGARREIQAEPGVRPRSLFCIKQFAFELFYDILESLWPIPSARTEVWIQPRKAFSLAMKWRAGAC
jgi:hypothetical protein